MTISDFEEAIPVDFDWSEDVIDHVWAQDDEEIDAMDENEDYLHREVPVQELLDKDVNPVHVLDVLKELYDENQIDWFQNSKGNIGTHAEFKNGNGYIFYMNWENANLVKYYPKTGRKYVISYGNWRYADIPLNDILRAQRKRKLDDDLDGDDSAAKRQKMEISTTSSK